MKPLTLAALTAAALLLGAGRADASSFLGSLDTSAAPRRRGPASGGVRARFEHGLPPVRAAHRDRRGARGRRARRRERLRASGSAAPRRRGSPCCARRRDGVDLEVVATAPIAGDQRRGRGREASTACTSRSRAATRSASCSGRARSTSASARARAPTARSSGSPSRATRAGRTAAPAPSCSSTPRSSPTSTATAWATRPRTPTAAGSGWTGSTTGSRTSSNGDELDEDFTDDFGAAASAAARRATLGLLDVRRLRDGRATALLRVPKAGRVNVSVTLPANRRTGAGPVHDDPHRRHARQARRAACA